MKPNYITRKIKDFSHYLVIEVSDYEAVIAECCDKRHADMIANCLNQAILES